MTKSDRDKLRILRNSIDRLLDDLQTLKDEFENTEMELRSEFGLLLDLLEHTQ